MPRHRDHHRPRWVIPAVLTLTAAVATAGVYFWTEMEDQEASSGFRSEDDEEERMRSRGMIGRDGPVTGPSSAAAAAAAGGAAVGVAGKGIAERVGRVLKGFFEGSDYESDASRGGGRERDRDDRRATSRGLGPGPGPGSGPGPGPVPGLASRDIGPSAPRGNHQLVDWDKKRIVALVISSFEEVEESILHSLPTPLDLSRCVLLLFVFTPSPSAPASLVHLSPRPMPVTPSSRDTSNQMSASPANSVHSYASSVKSFARTQPSPPIISADSSPSLVPSLRTPLTSGRTSRADELADFDEDVLSTPTPAGRKGATSSSSRLMPSSGSEDESKRAKNVRPGAGFRSAGSRYKNSDSDSEPEDLGSDSDSSLPALITKTFGPGFPPQQILQYATPTGVVHMLRHLGVSIVFISESCASVPNPGGSMDDTLSAVDATPTPATYQQQSLNPASPPPGGVLPAGGGEIVGMLRDWVGEIVLVLDEDEDDSGPTAPSAVSGGEDENVMAERRRKGKAKSKTPGAATGRRRKWLDKEKGIGRGITIVDRSRLGMVWRARVEGR